MRIVVVGATGQLGAAVVHECAPLHEVVALGHADLDITDDRAVITTIGKIAADAVVNCAAFNDVDGLENRPIEALNGNAFAVRALARAAGAAGAAFVHYGTDFVFDGTKEAPYVEDDRPNPRSVYAVSKLVGEWFAADAPRAYVLRVESLFGRAPGARPAKGSAAALVAAMLANKEVRVFVDRTVSPTYVMDGARATREILERAIEPGVYHCVNSDHCTWLEFVQEIARQLGLEPRLQPVRLEDVKLRAERPKYCALSNAKLRSAGIAMPTWTDAVSRYLQEFAGDLSHHLADRQT